jgi:hypothetical protein
MKLPPVIALFGEAEKGSLDTAYFCKNLDELFEKLGEPPDETKGLFCAIQALLYGKPLLYFRVRSEGLSTEDYLSGLQLLREDSFSIIRLQALFLPGVGSKMVIDESCKLCLARKSLLIMNECDFFDYLIS